MEHNMIHRTVLATALLSTLSGVALAQAYGAAAGVDPSEDVTARDVPQMRGIHWTRDVATALRISRDQADQADRAERAAAHQSARTRNPLMTNHGGKVMTTAVTKNIFWGTTWGSYTGDKLTGLDAWYTGYSGSNYAKTVTEYTGTNGQVGPTTAHQGHIVDTSAASGGGNTAAVLAEVCKVIISPDSAGNGYYAVYTDLPRGNAGYCAWHASGKCGSTTVQFAFFWKLDGDAGCDPQDTSGLHSQGLAALANVTAHELSEARTDPSTSSATGAGGWYDSSGSENGDKCAWTFGAPLVTFSNSSQWKVQGEWSNAAYTASTGYPNSSGQKGCLGGL
jgi:hypothetical protein